MNPERPPPAPVVVGLDREQLQATVHVARAANVAEADVLAALARAGVVHGVSLEGVKLALRRRAQKIVVARGTLPLPGAAGRIECETIDAAQSATFTPLEDARGTVDNHAGHVTQTATPGQVLARIVAPLPGIDGKRVTGEVIPAERGKEAAPILGPGARLSDDRTQVLATRAGMPIVDGDHVSVLQRCEVKNVDFASGDVYFAGSVTVLGDVMPGFTVVATEDIEVKGTVERGTLRAGGKIKVHGGISRGAVLESIGDVAVRFIGAGCKVTSGGALQVTESALGSTLVARRILVGRQLVAGHTRASELISAAILGSESEVQTRVELSQPRRPSWRQATELVRQHAKEKAEIQSLRLSLQLAGHDAARLKRLVPQEVLHELKLLTVDHQAAMVSLAAAPEEGAVVATARMYRGVSAILYDRLHVVPETVGKRTLRLLEGSVVAT